MTSSYFKTYFRRDFKSSLTSEMVNQNLSMGTLNGTNRDGAVIKTVTK